MSSSYNSYTETVKGTGFLQLNPECSAHAPNLVLPSSYTGRSQYNNTSPESEFILPKVSDILTPIELSDVSQVLNSSVLDALQMNVNEVANLEHLRTGRDIRELRQGLKLYNGISHSNFPWYELRLFIAPLIVIGIMILGYVFWIKLKGIKEKWNLFSKKGN